MTGEIAKRVRKLSVKISQLQQQIRIINATSSANMQAAVGSAGGSTSGTGTVESCDGLAARISQVLVVSPSTPRSRESSFAAEKSKESRSTRLRKIMMVGAVHNPLEWQGISTQCSESQGAAGGNGL